MSDRVFLDTNIWLYLYSQDDLEKRSAVEALVGSSDKIFISTQVLNELANVLIRKKGVSVASVRQAVGEIMNVVSLHVVTFDVVQRALNVVENSKYSYYDSLIIASALESSCSVLYSEDLHNKHVVEKRLEILNPFK